MARHAALPPPRDDRIGGHLDHHLDHHVDHPTKATCLVRRIAATRVTARVCVIALVVLCVAWELWLAPTGRGTLALKALPLVPAVVGLLRDRLYTYRWLSLLVWLYVAEGTVRAASDHGTARWLAAIELLLCAGLFAACAAQVRLRLALVRLLAVNQGAVTAAR